MEFKCILCGQVISESDVSAVISQKGADGINLAAEQRGDTSCAVSGNILFADETTVIRGELIDTFKTTRKKLQLAVLNRVQHH